MSPTYPTPFGDYYEGAFASRQTRAPSHLRQHYENFRAALTLGDQIAGAIRLTAYVDQELDNLRVSIAGGDSGFSYFRGTLLEEIVCSIAWSSVNDTAADKGIEIIKLSTSEGVLAGVSLEVSRDNIPDPVRIRLRRDREDVTIGFRRSFELYNDTDDALAPIARLPNEVIPICVIACKMYIDATRLENVTSKAKNLSVQHARCTYLVAAEWDALGSGWHDARGRVIDSLFAPVSEMVFLRGEHVRRPTSRRLREHSLANPYRAEQFHKLAGEIARALSIWLTEPSL